MTPNDGNKYRIARQMAGMTQERWAEAINVDVRSVARYESGETLPADETVAMMVEISGLAALGYWHLKNKSAIADELLPTVERIPAAQAVVQLVVAMADFQTRNSELLRMVADGRISSAEIADWKNIREKLDLVVKAAIQLRYAEGVPIDA